MRMAIPFTDSLLCGLVIGVFVASAAEFFVSRRNTFTPKRRILRWLVLALTIAASLGRGMKWARSLQQGLVNVPRPVLRTMLGTLLVAMLASGLFYLKIKHL